MATITGRYGAGEIRDLRVGRRWLTAAVLAFAGFGLLAILVQAHSLDAWNARTTAALQARSNVGQDIALTALGYLGAVEVTTLLALGLALPLWKGLRMLALLPLLTLGATVLVEWATKHLVHDPAPPPTLLRVPAFMPHGLLLRGHPPFSYPSGHMARAVFLYGLVLYLATRWRLFGADGATLAPVLLALIILMGYSLIYVGDHWLSDVLGGFFLAASALLLVIGYLERKRALPPPVKRQFR